MINRTFKLTLLMAGLFLMGVVSGGLVTARYMRNHPPRRPGPEVFGPSQMRRLTEGLQLTDDQVAKIKPIIDSATEELSKLRREGFSSSAKVIEKMDTAIAKVLTPEQKTLLADMQAKQRDRMQRWMAERQKRRDDRDNRNGPPRPDMEHDGDRPPMPPDMEKDMPEPPDHETPAQEQAGNVKTE